MIMTLSEDPLYKYVETITVTVIYADYNGRNHGYKPGISTWTFRQLSEKNFRIPCNSGICSGSESGFDLSDEIAHAVRERLESYDTRCFSCHYPVDGDRCGINYQFRISITYLQS